ncbi:MAG: hypothetical protein HY298_10135 [Verrucomicrobia bacterium]|nr:hypothetical protein [Verrucomicrobiota bacterium]
MKTTKVFFLVLTSCLLGLAACNKTDQAKQSAQAYHGIQVDWTKFDAEFASAGPDVQGNISSLKRFFRYGQFPEALVELDKLSSNSALTESQKKLVNDLIEQTKKAIEKAPPPGQ